MSTHLLKLFPLLFFLCFASFSRAQPALHWDHTYHGSLASDRGNDVVVDDDGNVYITGSTDVFGENKNVLTIKYNAQGDTLWTRKWNRKLENDLGNGIDEGFAIALDLFNNVYVTGRSQSSGNDFDIILIKYDSDGNKKGFSIFDNGLPQFEFTDAGLGIDVDPFGNAYIVGKSINDGILIKYDSNDSPVEEWKSELSRIDDIVILKEGEDRVLVAGGSGSVLEYDIIDGDLVHVYRSHGPVFYGQYYTHAIHASGNGNVYAIVGRKSDVEFEPSTLRIIKFVNGEEYGPDDPPILDYDMQGIYGVSLAEDGQDTIYCLANKPKEDGTGREVLLVKLKPTINAHQVAWQESYASGSTTPVDLSLRSDKDSLLIYVSGNSDGDISMLEYNNSGDITWMDEYDCGSNGADVATSMTSDLHGNLYLTGYSNCEGNSSDVKTVKYCTCPPATPDTIEGISMPCIGDELHLTVPMNPAVEFYTWTLPSGWSGASMTNEIDIVVTDTAVTGLVSVVAHSKFCSSEPRTDTLTAFRVPEIGEIQGPLNTCSNQNVSYSVDSTDYISHYEWFLPEGWAGASSTRNIDVVSDASGVIRVVAHNACGVSDTQSVHINVTMTPAMPEMIHGPAEICIGEAATFSVDDVQGVEYLWDFPDGWTVTETGSGEVLAGGVTSGTIQVVAQVGDCMSPPQTTEIFVVQPPLNPTANGPTMACIGDTVSFTINAAQERTSYHWQIPNEWDLVDSAALSIIAVASTDATIEVVATNACGVSDTTEFQIGVYSDMPTIPTIAGPEALCIGTSYTFQAESEGATSFHWDLPGNWTTVANDSSMKLTLTAGEQDGHLILTTSNACGQAPQAGSLYLSVADRPDTVIMENFGEQVVFTALDTAVAYQWMMCDPFEELSGATLQSYHPVINGYYAVQLNNNGCIDTSRCHLFLNISKPEVYTPKGFDVFPNPTGGNITISDAPDDVESIKVYNSFGTIVYESDGYIDFPVKLDLSALTPGIYVLHLEGDAATRSRRFIKHH